MFRKIISERLDRFIQKKNVLVVNSTGNIDLEDVYINKDKFPYYLSKFDVLSPSECRTIFSVGNIAKIGKEFQLANNARTGISETFINKLRDIFIYQKPEVCFLGGNIDLDSIKEEDGRLQFELNESTAINVINKDGDVTLEAGSSFSAPLIANSFTKLLELYGTKFKNSETYKAILLNKCEYQLIKNDETHESRPIFYLKNIDDVAYCKDSVYLQFEGIWNPIEQFETRDKKPYVKGFEVNFFVPEGITNMRIAISHSNDYKLQKIDKPAISFVIGVIKPNGKTTRSTYNTLAKPTHLHYGIYKIRKESQNGLWKIQFKIRGHNIPKERLKDVNVRFGISVRLYPEQDLDFNKIYNVVKQKSNVKTSNEQILTNKIKLEITEEQKDEAVA